MLLGALSNITFTFFALFYLPIFLKKIKQEDDPKRLWRERWGNFAPDRFAAKSSEHSRIWIHAVSVGEVRSLVPLLEELSKKGVEVLLSTVTPTGQQAAKKLVGDRAFYFPFDLSGAVKKTLNAIEPDMILLTETELWPNFILQTAKKNIPLGLINGRLSIKSMGRYRIIQGAMKQLLEKFSFFSMQTDQDAGRLLNLGADSSKVFVLGNMKFDAKPLLPGRSSKEIKDSFKIPAPHKVWVAGSTHPGEEKHILAVFTRLKSIYPTLTLILAPRHVERAASVLRLATEFNFKPLRLGQENSSESTNKVTDVLVVDTIGQLNNLYSFADIVFVGGSLVEHGGQNPIEPALFKRSVLTGPHVFNFKYVYEQLEKAEAVQMIISEDELFLKAKELMASEPLRDEMGQRAYDQVMELAGATTKTLHLISRFLDKPQPVSEAADSLPVSDSVSKVEDSCPTS